MLQPARALSNFLRGARPRANAPDPMGPALDDLRAALRDFPSDARGRRRFADAEGGERWLQPFEQSEAAWRERAGEVGPEAAARELLAWTAELRAHAGPAREAVERARAAHEDERAWESQAYRVPSPPPRDLDRAFDGRLVWLYHGTATSKLRAILRQGIRHDAPKRPSSEANRRRVFLTSYSGGSLYSGGMPGATMYAQRAAGLFGGEPLVLRVIVPWGWIGPDEDDADLSCANIQFECPRTLSPEMIMEANDRRLREPLDADEPWRAGLTGPRDRSLRRR